jgi:hypothetical protein
MKQIIRKFIFIMFTFCFLFLLNGCKKFETGNYEAVCNVLKNNNNFIEFKLDSNNEYGGRMGKYRLYLQSNDYRGEYLSFVYIDPFSPDSDSILWDEDESNCHITVNDSRNQFGNEDIFYHVIHQYVTEGEIKLLDEDYKPIDHTYSGQQEFLDELNNFVSTIDKYLIENYNVSIKC